MNLLHVVGARPNFMKAAPVLRACSRLSGVKQIIVHSGQHYDHNMSDIFFEQLGIPAPDINLQVGSGSHAQQTAAIMERIEPVLLDKKPDFAVVYGDVNSTVAVALVCAKLGIRIAHVEAGLRSFDRTMPEEVNRLVTDQLADLLLTPSLDGNENLRKEGIPEKKVTFVGNVMIDTLIHLLPLAAPEFSALKQQLKLDHYGLVTLHRPSNVDCMETLQQILETLNEIASDCPLVFPIHPRTLNRLGDRREALTSRLQITEPLSYLQFLALQKHAQLVITDSGGIQEETTYLGVPCLTIRENTERPITVSLGTNILIGRDMKLLKKEVAQILGGHAKKGSIPPLWDGKASDRVAQALMSNLKATSTA